MLHLLVIIVTSFSPVEPGEQNRSSGSTQGGHVANGDGLGHQAGRAPWRQRREPCRETHHSIFTLSYVDVVMLVLYVSY